MKLNKLITGIAAPVALAFLILFSGCASKDDDVMEVVFDAEDPTIAEALEPSEDQEIDESSVLAVTSDEESAFQIEATAGAGRESKKNYTGWIATSIRPITSVKGNIKLYARPKKGTFALFAMNSDDKAVPVISSANEYTTTSFYLRAGKKIIKLCDDSSVVTAAKKTEKGIKLRYSIDKVAIVIIDLECISSKEGEPEDTIKITSTILSQSKKKTDFSLKLICDTVLGETDRHHFYSSANIPVKNEVIYHSMDEEKWFASKNAKATMQFILSGSDITPIETVALANFTTLDTKKWEADMTTFRSFDTVLSYNNSAVGIYWPKKTLAPDETGSDIFYISLATDGAIPGGADYILASTAAAEPEAETEPVEEVKQETAPVQQEVKSIQAVKEEDVAPAVVKEPEKQQEPVKEAVKETVPPAQETQPAQNVSAVQEPAIDRLSMNYIQNLLDRIEQLEEGDPDVNKAEINRLNAELDEIIAILDAQ